MTSLSRRSLLVRAAAVGGGMALGFNLSSSARAFPAASEINAWIVIQPDNTVIIRVARAEMGQGIATALPMLIAEELDCDWARVITEFISPAENVQRNRRWGDMSTSASRSVSASQAALRQAGATARAMLIAAAAARWDVPATECSAANGIIAHGPSGRQVTFGDVAAAAGRLAPPAKVVLKDSEQWRLIGTRQKHFDTHDKVTGKTIFGIDVRLPNMLYAAILHCPTFRGGVASLDEEKIKSLPGVRKVVALADAVAVVADSWWRAKRAADVLPVRWRSNETGNISSSTIQGRLREGLSASQAGIGRNVGDLETALARAVRRIEAEYSVPYLSHATMEPQNCTAHVTDGRVEIWAPTQDPEAALAIAASAAGVPRNRVILHATMLGGGFGRRGLVQDYVRQAVLIAKAVSQPVKLIWTREQDLQHGIFRPASMARMRAGLDGDGIPVAWSVRVAGQSILMSVAPEMMPGANDPTVLQGFLDDMPYAIANYRVDHTIRNAHVPIGPWRSIDHSQNAFFKEGFIDEMAHAADVDPYLFRRKLLHGKSSELAVLDVAAERAGWGTELPLGVARGIALHSCCNSICAQVVEISANGGALQLRRIVSAIDCGHVVNPLTVELQTQSAVVFGLTAALYGEITIRDGAVEQSNFHDYRMLRLSEVPVIETVVLPGGGRWGGVGEPPLPPVAPALCNAIFAATGKRIRALPVKNHGFQVAALSRLR